jgi:hypothetical protein
MRAARLYVCLITTVCPITTFFVTTVLAQSQDTFTPVVASPLMPTTYAVEGTDNKQHIVYELVITNTGTAAATLEKIEVVSPDSAHRVLVSFEGDALLARLRFTGENRSPRLRSNSVERGSFWSTSLWIKACVLLQR